MRYRWFNLTLAAVWLVVAGGLFFREEWMSANLRERVGEGGPLLSGMAAVLAAYNLVRWWAAGREVSGRAAALDDYRRRVGPLAAKDPPPVENPDLHSTTPTAGRGERRIRGRPRTPIRLREGVVA